MRQTLLRKASTSAPTMLLSALLWSTLALRTATAFSLQQSPTVSTITTTTTNPTFLSATTTKQVVYDGPEWTSIQDSLGLSTPFTDYGKMTVVVGIREDTGDKIVGVVSNDDDDKGVKLQQSKVQVHPHSIAKIPQSGVSDQEAVNTMIAALTGVQCTLPRVEAVGGANATVENGMVSGKVVILGGSEYACFAAEGLAALGTKVSLVSTSKVKVNNQNVQVLPPAVGDDEIGFASHVGEFDSLLDTADDERPEKRFLNNNQGGEDDMMSRGTTLRLLKQRHNCERYVSSMTQAQSIVNKEGVLWGPGKVKSHLKDIQQHVTSKPATFQSITPPPSFGHTVETLLSKGIIYKNNKDFLGDSGVTLRGWSLKDFMESSTWPTDSSGGGSRMVRFGLPVLEDEDVIEDEDDDMISAPPQTANAEFFERSEWDRSIEEEEKQRNEQDAKNPFVKLVVGQQGMYDDIVRDEKDAVLFLSATWCRTCRSLNPKFTTMARRSLEESEAEDADGIMFAKADTTTETGKELSRLLKVDAVPAFVLFRKGRRYGPNLSISRIPSKKLSAAIERLQSGEDWDTEAINKQAGEKQQ